VPLFEIKRPDLAYVGAQKSHYIVGCSATQDVFGSAARASIRRKRRASEAFSGTITA